MNTAEAIAAAALETGIDEKLLTRIADIESSGNPSAHTAGSKYFGLFQLSQAEFLEFGGGDILDAFDNARAAARRIVKDAVRWFVKHGSQAEPIDLYMIHQQGWSGYHALLAASAGQPAWKAIRPYYDSDERAQLAIDGNTPGGASREVLTAVQFLDLWQARLGFGDPSWLTMARRELGVKEAPGSADSAKVLAYYREAGHQEVKHDETAWCAAFVGAMLVRAGVKPSGSLMARSYLKWGMPLAAPRPGCVAVFWRNDPNGSEGHVGFFTGLTSGGGDILLLGGNQSDMVSISTQPKARLLGYRWPAATSGATVPIIKTEGLTMADRFKDLVEQFGAVTPLLARAIGGPAGGVAAAILVDLIEKSGKKTADEAPDETLKRLGVGEALPILKAAESALETVGTAATPPAGGTSGSVALPLGLTALDRLLGLTGYKTYIVILLAAVANIAAGLGILPPDILTLINTGLAALGGAALVSKVERYANIATGLLGKKKA
jgi:uncharacterized protein (TIGR02594 family)